MRPRTAYCLASVLVGCSVSAAPPTSDGVARWQGRQAVLEYEAEYGSLANSTECKGRWLAYQYALKLQPARAPLLEVFDALFGTSRGGYQCNVTRPAPAEVPAWPPSAADSPPLPGSLWYVDAEKGDDGAAGTAAAPFKTVARGVSASRAASTERAVVLRAGIHYLTAPVALDARDSGLTLTNFPGEEVWLSGASGGPLAPEWKPFNTTNSSAPPVPCEKACADAGHCCMGDVSSFNQPSCAFGCAFGSPDSAFASSETQCRALCDAAVNANCKFAAQFQNGSGSHEFQMCGGCPKGCSAADGVSECYEGCTFAYNHGHTGATVFVTDVDAGRTGATPGAKENRLAGVTGLFTVEPHARLTRARFPNANPEDRDSVHTQPTLHYIAPPVVPLAVQHFKNLSAAGLKNDSTLPQFNAYSSGSCAGGAGDPNCPCGIWTDVRDGVWSSESYWCGNFTAGGWSNMDQGFGIFHGPAIPVGLKYNTSLKTLASLAKYKNATGAIVNSWRDQGWFNTMFEVATHDAATGTFVFAKTATGTTKGGFQGGRGYRINNTKGVPHEETLDCNGGFFIENVFEELDSPGEWWYDERERKLYVYPNATAGAAPPTSLLFVVPQLSELLGVRGSQAAPARNVTVRGIGFRDARYTYMDPHGVPSGGDWALERMGALFLEGTEGVEVTQCNFKRLDGNGVMISGYNRHAAVRDSWFSFLGGSAMAAWGYTDEDSGMGGEQPRFTIISGNMGRELGVWELQSSMWFQAKACQTTLSGNLFFNGPRAAINFNDGFGGGNLVRDNLIFNTCRHSGDHGPINTWDRQPFLTDVRQPGVPSYDAALTTIRNNFVIANYGASQAVDNDDGSSWYDIHDNFFFDAEGLKQDFGGHDSRYHHNVNYVVKYDGQQCLNSWPFVPGHQHIFHDNKCVVSFNDDALRISGLNCKHPMASADIIDVLFNNSYYTPHGNASANDCITVAQMSAGGSTVEEGSEMHTLPTDEELFGWARAKLGMQ